MGQGLSALGHNMPYPEVENMADPDDANSWTCAACRLPIFSTPFVVDRSGGSNLLLHDQCSGESLPPELAGHPLHPRIPLILRHRRPEEHSSTTEEDYMRYYCKRCWSICGSKFYECPMGDDRECGFRLDLPCALPNTVLHRSHEHRLHVAKVHGLSIPSPISFICRACGKQHEESNNGRPQFEDARVKAYACTICDFWLHPDCALLPNAIVDTSCHEHPLLLRFSINTFNTSCNICTSKLMALGFYACVTCRYYVHIDCSVNSTRQRFQPVLVREAEFPNLLRLPMENEQASAMPRIMRTTTPNCHTHTHYSLGNTTSDDHTVSSRIGNSSSLTDHSSIDSLETIRVHEHPLIYHHDTHSDIIRVCNACAQIILPSDPFYSCADNNNNNTCKDFFLHSCCSSFPKTFSSFHIGYCSFTPKVATKPFTIFECMVCKHKTNGSAYYVEGREEKYMDVVCALMPHLITHGAHGKAHILQGRWVISEFNDYLMSLTCKCCLRDMNEYPITSYTCSNCRSFSIHPHCALLPDTVTHKFDRHPLKLITSSSRGGEEENGLCEICEKDIDWRKWHYGCEVCEQYFHANCIPCLDRLSKIKFGFEVSVGCHECPIACVRAVSVDGHLCGHCGENIRESDDIAFECSKCYFRMHEGCVQELMIKP
ncbi:Unknown protein [Striga hermonthica]|uniref:DC1 domain-containing protein n=1 Tax=Striga hermonthica TaxID=68872 RepID=A0A9N7MSG4_STRHE|nr:Unknown protein [Striga hermonthica]